MNCFWEVVKTLLELTILYSSAISSVALGKQSLQAFHSPPWREIIILVSDRGGSRLNSLLFIRADKYLVSKIHTISNKLASIRDAMQVQAPYNIFIYLELNNCDCQLENVRKDFPFNFQPEGNI